MRRLGIFCCLLPVFIAAAAPFAAYGAAGALRGLIEEFFRAVGEI